MEPPAAPSVIASTENLPAGGTRATRDRSIWMRLLNCRRMSRSPCATLLFAAGLELTMMAWASARGEDRRGPAKAYATTASRKNRRRGDGLWNIDERPPLNQVETATRRHMATGLDEN